MTELHLRNIDPWAVELIRDMARRKSQSMEQFLKDHLYAFAQHEKKELLAEIRREREELRQQYGVGPDSTPGIRAERDAM
jgi:hypothetical protein